MTTLLENPLPIILFGILAEAGLGIGLLRTGRGVLLLAMGGVLVVVLAGVGLEWLVVTDVERVEASFEAAAAALEANDQEGVLAHIHPSATDTRNLVIWGLRRVEFTKVNISALEIEIIKTTSPPTAKARISGMVHFRDRSGVFPYGSYPIELTAWLREESDRWVLTRHQWKNDPRGR